jgi:hypothetical protein
MVLRDFTAGFAENASSSLRSIKKVKKQAWRSIIAEVNARIF